MGNSSSQDLKNYLTNDVNYQQTVTATLNLQNKSTINSTAINDFSLQNGGPDCCVEYDKDGKKVGTLPNCTGTGATIKCEGGLNIDQSIKSSTTAVQSVSSKFAQQLSTQLQNTAQADIANAVKQLQEGFFGNNESNQEVENRIVNKINTTLNSDTVLNIVNSMVINSVNKNTANIVNCGEMSGESCNFTQDITVQILTQNILNSIGDLVQNNQEINDFYNKINNQVSSEQKGLAALFAQIFAALGEFGLAIIIGSGVLLFILILIIVVALFFR
jgi:hypothetical protein